MPYLSNKIAHLSPCFWTGLQLLILFGALGAAGCAEDLCKSKAPAFEVQLSLDEPSIAAQLASVRVDVTAQELHKVTELAGAQLKNTGRAALVVVVGEAGAPGFGAEVQVELLDDSGEVLLAASDSFSGSGDACNFFKMALRLPRADGPISDLGPPVDVQFYDMSGSCGPETCAGCCLPDGRCAAGTTDGVCGAGGESCVSCLESGGACRDQACCTPQCEGLACGAEDGCGGICASGDCPEGQSCVSGSCRCTPQSCGDGCCAPDQRCLAGDSDAACGSGGASCSNCGATGEICQNQSCTCVPSCPTDRCNISDGCGGICQCGGNDYCNSTNCEPLVCQLCSPNPSIDCNSQCQAWGSTGGVCGNPGSTDPADCCDCNNKLNSSTSPLGFLDEITSNGVARGWACDQDNPWASISVHIYVGGPAGSAAASSYATVADDENLSTLVRDACGGGDYHRFNFAIPDYQSKGGQPVYAYGINWPGTGGVNVLLQECPKYIP